MSNVDYFSSLSRIAERIRNQELTAEWLVTDLLKRLEIIDAQYHAYQTVLTQKALLQARSLDQACSEGRIVGPLHGVPIAVKDLCAVKGVVLGAGTEVLKVQGEQVVDSEVVSRLKKAGAIIIATATLTEGALASYHPNTTVPVNPWRADRWSGVSSSGSAVAVATGQCFAAIGSDTGGSIRFPAAVNGVVGLKPSFDLVPVTGCFPLAPSMDHIGPITRTVTDAALMLSVMADKPDLALDLGIDLAGMTIGIDYVYCCDGTDADIVDPIVSALEIFKQAGASVIEVNMPAWQSVEQLWMPMCAAEAKDVHGPWYPAKKDLYGNDFAQVLERASSLEPSLLQKAHSERDLFTDNLNQLFTEIDILFCPTLGIAVPPAIRKQGQEYPELMRFTAVFNASGHPTLSIPCGFSADGMPLSLQLIAAHFDEKALIKAGRTYESFTNTAYIPPPNL